MRLATTSLKMRDWRAWSQSRRSLWSMAHTGGVASAIFDRKSIGRKVTAPQLVGVPGGREDLNVRHPKAQDRLLARAGDREDLPRDRPGIFQSGVADIAR